MIQFALLVVFPALMAYAAASDLVTMTIPNRLSLLRVVGFSGMAALAGLAWTDIAAHVAAGFAVLVVMFGMFAFGWIGGGDAKLAAATALWFGLGSLPEYLFVTSVLGGVLTVAILALRRSPLPGAALRWTWLIRLHDPKCGVPYGIALAAAALLLYPHTAIWQALVAA